MPRRAALVVAIVLGGFDRADACRCTPMALAAYFEQASVVFAGRTVAVEKPQDPAGFRSVGLQIITPYKGDPAGLVYRTGDTPANCGIDVTPGITYIVFAATDPGEPEVAYVTTCNGTRRIDLATPAEGEPFIDVPAEGVVAALLALSRAHEHATVPIGGIARPNSIIGLVELPSVFDRDDEEAAGVAFQPVVVRAAPRDDAAVVAEIRNEEAVITREVAYELDGAAVYERRDGWLRLSLADGRAGWLKALVGASFHPLEELLLNRLGYLTPGWDGRLWPNPGAGYPTRPELAESIREQPPVRIVEATRVADSLWLKIQMYADDPCAAGEDQTRVIASGWIPAWSADGEVTSWFFARGC